MFYKIYTDGSTKGNGKEKNTGGYAFIVVDGFGNIVDAYAETGIENTTNNRMELTAIIAALFMNEKRMRIKDECAEIFLYSDSEYALNSLFKWSDSWAKNGWKTASGSDVKNQDLIKPFYDKQWGPFLKNIEEGKRNSWSRFSYYYVKGHSIDNYNNTVDKLATGEYTVDQVLEKYKTLTDYENRIREYIRTH